MSSTEARPGRRKKGQPAPPNFIPGAAPVGEPSPPARADSEEDA